METVNTNTPSNSELITSADVPRVEYVADEVVESPEVIEGIPEAIAPQATREAIGSVALGDVGTYHIPVMQESTRFANGKVEVHHPGSQSINQAAANGTLPEHLTVIR